MELTLLRRMVAALEGELVGRRFEQAWALPPSHLALALGSRAAPRLWFSAQPEDPHLYLRPGSHPTPDRPPAFAMALRKHARGRRIDGLSLLGDDRVVALRWRGDGAHLIFELVPRRATAMVVDGAGVVVSVWNPRRGRPAPGQPYTPPARQPRTPVGELTPEDWNELQAAADRGELDRQVLRTIAGATQLIAREVAARAAEGEQLREALIAEARRAAEADDEPRVYAPVAPASLRRLPPGRGLELAPYVLRSRHEDPSLSFGDLLSAAAFYYPLRARLGLLDRARTQIAQGAARQRQRLERAARRLTEAPADRQDPARLRQLGDLLLANPNANAVAGKVRVDDLYAGGDPVEIPVDSRLDLRENAERHYHRAQRLERKIDKDAQRLENLKIELDGLAALEQRAAEMSEIEQFNASIEAARALGLPLRAHHLREPEAVGAPTLDEITRQAPESLPGILRVVTATGAEVLVGRSATANDRLTHEIAGRADWWLHAVGPGSHVVLRNPEGLEEPRPEELVAAARLAAWFSRARGATKVEVHWTRARQVRRPRGGRPGQALMANQRSIVVEPGAPAAISGDSDAP